MASCERLPFRPTVLGIAVRVRWADNPVRRTNENLAGCPLVNAKTAKALGRTFPQSLLVRATNVTE